MSALVWPPFPLAPAYKITDICEPDVPDAEIETVEARLVFRDWLDREVSVFTRRSHPRNQANGAAVLHIVGGTQTINPDDLAVWTSLGYASASFDWQLVGVPNRPPERTSRYPADLVAQYSPTPSLAAAVLPVGLQAAMVCLDWLAQAPRVDPLRLGVVGISWGGYLAWMLAAHDSRVRAIAPAFGCGGLFAAERSAAAHDPDVRDFWQQHWDPSGFGPRIAAPVCYLSATNDFFGDPLVAERLLASVPCHCVRHYLPNVDHSLDPAQTRLAQAWLRHHLLGGPPVPRGPDHPTDANGTLWWSDDIDGPSMYRCWQPGPPPPDRAVLAFAHHHENNLTLSTPISLLSPSSISVTDARHPTSGLPFGLGWQWELGSTRHLAHDASAIPPVSPDHPWSVKPARPDNSSEPIAVILHVARATFSGISTCRTLKLFWSVRPDEDSVTVLLYLRTSGSHLCKSTVPWSASDSSLRISLSTFASLPPDVDWSVVGRIQIISSQPRVPFFVGPLIPILV